MAKKKALPKINFYHDNNGKTVAVTSYARKRIRAVAKCSPEDEYNEKVGEKVAQDKLMEKFWDTKLRRLNEIIFSYDELISELRQRQHKVEQAFDDTLDSYEEYFGKSYFKE